jgi:hypothetical protein
VLLKLRAIDHVSYVRFASIYRDFRDLDGFAKEIDELRGEDTGRHGMPALGEDTPASEERTDEHAPVAAGE